MLDLASAQPAAADHNRDVEALGSHARESGLERRALWRSRQVAEIGSSQDVPEGIVDLTLRQRHGVVARR